MADFDPMAHLAALKQENSGASNSPSPSPSSGGGFDPMAHLSKLKAENSGSGPNSDQPAPSDGILSKAGKALQYMGTDPISGPLRGYLEDHPDSGLAALKSAGNALALNGLAHAQAAAEPAMNKAMDLFTGNHVSDDTPDYAARLKENQDNLAQSKKDHPYSSALGTVAGMGVGGIAMSPALAALPGAEALAGVKAAKDAGLAARATAAGARALGSAYQGAAYGALTNPEGDEGGTDLEGQLKGRAKQAAIGGIVGGVAQPVIEGAMNAGQWVGNKLSDAADWSALKAIGLSKADVKKIQKNKGVDPEYLKQIGRESLDNDIIPWVGGHEKIMNRANAAKDAAGDKVGGLLDEADQGFSKMAPEGIRRAGPDVSAEYTPVQSSGVLGVPTGMEKTGKIQSIDYTPMVPKEPGRIDASEIASSMKSNPVVQEIKTTPGMEGSAGRVDQMLDTLGNNGNNLTLREAQNLRQRIDKGINFNKSVDEMRGAQPALYEMRDAIRDRMNDQVNDYAARTGGEAADQLLKANQNYSKLSDVEKYASNRYAGDLANRAIGLTDTIAGGAGAVVGGAAGSLAGPMGAEIGAAAGGAAGAGFNKVARTYGNSFMARSEDAISKMLAGMPDLKRLAAQNPAIIPALAQKLNSSQQGDSSPQTPAISPEVLGLLQKNPQLIDTIDDEKLRAQVKDYIKRKPAETGSNYDPDQYLGKEDAKNNYLQGH